MKPQTVQLKRLYACKESIEFASNYDSLIEAWNNCPRGDWMLWLASKLNVDKRKLFLAKGKCAETVIHLMKDERSRKAVQGSIDYGNGIINEDELRIIASAASASAASAYASDASAAAAYASAASDAYASDASAKLENQLETANICREILTGEIIKRS